ncbi:MAG: MFS transporter [Candidatus Zixiibacteriota bacterium]|nr:MAG: MFS transporter [candidate division Zixibacteria bacterium]
MSLFRRAKGFGGEVWAWITYDFANSAFITSLYAVIFNQYFAGVIAGGPAGTDFTLLGWNFNLPGATLWELSVLLATLLVIVLGPLAGIYADRTGTRKRLLGLAVILGATATAGLAGIRPGQVVFGGVLFALALAAWLLSINLYNSFLPQVAREEDVGLVSGISWALGYLGGGLCLLLNLFMLQNPRLLGFPEGTFGLGHIIGVVALWWLVFSLPLFLGVRERPPAVGAPGHAADLRQLLRGLGRTLTQVRAFRPLALFLLAYVLFSNGIETSIGAASIFGAEVLRMDTPALIRMFLLVQFTAFAGALGFGVLVDRIGNKISLALSLCGWLVALVWVYNLGLFLDPVTEFHLAAVLVGIVMGGSQAAARSLFARFTPPRRSAEFFAFYGVAGRVSSALGPLTFAAVNTATRSLRGAILALAVYFALGLILLLRVDESAGREGARRMEEDVRQE